MKIQQKNQKIKKDKISNIEKITCWYFFNKEKNKYEYAFFHKGWEKIEKPIPKTKNQKSWLKQKWKKKFKYLDKNEKIQKVISNLKESNFYEKLKIK